MFEVFLLTYQRFLEVLFSHSITKTLRFLLKKRSPGHFSIKTKRPTESSPLLAFDAKAEKSRSLVTCVRYASETLWISGLAVAV